MQNSFTPIIFKGHCYAEHTLVNNLLHWALLLRFVTTAVAIEHWKELKEQVHTGICYNLISLCRLSSKPRLHFTFMNMLLCSHLAHSNIRIFWVPMINILKSSSTCFTITSPFSDSKNKTQEDWL